MAGAMRAAAATGLEAAASAGSAGREAEMSAARAASDAAAAIAASEAASRAALSRVDATIAGTSQRAAEAVRSVPAAACVSRETSVNVAAQRLARDLAAIPGIERYGTLRLEDLDRAGPRPLRTMWRLARHDLADRYGQMTIGEMVDQLGRPGSGPAA